MLSCQNSATTDSPADSLEVDGGTCDLQALHSSVALLHALGSHLVNCLLGSIDSILAKHKNLIVRTSQLVRSSSLGLGKVGSQSFLRSQYGTPSHCNLRILNVNLPRPPGQSLGCALGAGNSILGLCFA